jgi:hypothetical protein
MFDEEVRLFVLLTKTERATIVGALACFQEENRHATAAELQSKFPALFGSESPVDCDKIKAIRKTLSRAVSPIYAHFDNKWNRLYDRYVYPDAQTANANISAEQVIVVPVGAKLHDRPNCTAEDRVVVLFTKSEQATVLGALARFRDQNVRSTAMELVAKYPKLFRKEKPLDCDKIDMLLESVSLAFPPLYAHFDAKYGCLYGCTVYRTFQAADDQCDGGIRIVPLGVTLGENDPDFDDYEIAADRRVCSLGIHLSDFDYESLYGPARDEDGNLLSEGDPVSEQDDEDEWLDEDDDDNGEAIEI